MSVDKVCPKCGTHLIIRDGQWGEFLACPRYPDCRYTEPIKKLTDLTERKYQIDTEERYISSSADRWDFPMSHNWHRFYEVEAGRPDPGPAYPEQTKEEPIPPRPVVYNDQILSELIVLKNRINQHIDRSKRRKGQY